MTLQDTNDLFADDLRDPAYAAGYLNIALEEDGVEGFLYALQKVARAHSISKVAGSSDTSRESLYRALSEKGNPGIKPLTRILDTVGLRLTVVPAASSAQAQPAPAENAPDLHALMQAQQQATAELQAQVRHLTAVAERLAQAA